MKRNAELMQAFVGETIKEVIDTDSGHWADPDGFKLIFESGKVLEVSADTGQGQGYVVLEEKDDG